MINEEVLSGSWQEIREKIRSKWGQLSDDFLQQYSGNLDELIGTIQRETGESQEAIRAYLGEITCSCADVSRRWNKQINRCVSQLSDSVHDASRNLADGVAARCNQAGQLVQRRPVESLLAAFGIGMVTGLFVAFTIRSR